MTSSARLFPLSLNSIYVFFSPHYSTSYSSTRFYCSFVSSSIKFCSFLSSSNFIYSPFTNFCYLLVNRPRSSIFLRPLNSTYFVSTTVHSYFTLPSLKSINSSSTELHHLLFLLHKIKFTLHTKFHAPMHPLPPPQH